MCYILMRDNKNYYRSINYYIFISKIIKETSDDKKHFADA